MDTTTNAKMNNDFTFTLKVSGRTLDALFGRKLTDEEFDRLTGSDKYDNYFGGCPSIVEAVHQTLEAFCSDIADDDEEEFDEATDLYIKHPADCYKVDEYYEDEGVVITELNNIATAPSQIKEAKRKAFFAEEAKMREGDRKTWNALGVEKVLAIMKEKDLDGHTYRTLKAYEGLEDYVRHRLYREYGPSFRMPTDFKDIDYDIHHDFGDGQKRQIAYQKPRWVIDDTSVLYDIATDFKVCLKDTACLGRGSGARKVRDAIYKAFEVMMVGITPNTPDIPLDCLNIINQMAGLTTGNTVEA
jgi:hypothetical protein